MPNTDTKRIFIAFNIPDDFKSEISPLLRQLAENNDHISWVKPEILHVTLYFMGELNDEEVGRVRVAMQSLAGKFKAFEFGCGKVGVFPHYRRPRVIFLECVQKNGNSVSKFQKLLGDKLRQNAISVDSRAWRAHVTLGRVKDADASRPCNTDNAFRIDKTFGVKTYDLMMSRLHRDGPEHSILEKFDLIT